MRLGGVHVARPLRGAQSQQAPYRTLGPHRAYWTPSYSLLGLKNQDQPPAGPGHARNPSVAIAIVGVAVAILALVISVVPCVYPVVEALQAALDVVSLIASVLLVIISCAADALELSVKLLRPVARNGPVTLAVLNDLQDVPVFLFELGIGVAAVVPIVVILLVVAAVLLMAWLCGRGRYTT